MQGAGEHADGKMPVGRERLVAGRGTVGAIDLSKTLHPDHRTTGTAVESVL